MSPKELDFWRGYLIWGEQTDDGPKPIDNGDTQDSERISYRQAELFGDGGPYYSGLPSPCAQKSTKRAGMGCSKNGGIS